MKKGFTLIELLAVILILGIIALIAVPAVSNIVEEAKKGATEQSVNQFTNAIDKQIAINQMNSDPTDDIIDGTYDVPLDSKYRVKLKGQTPTDGWVKIEDGNVSEYSLVIGDYTVSYDGTNKTITEGNVQKLGPAVVYRLSGDELFEGDKINLTNKTITNYTKFKRIGAYDKGYYDHVSTNETKGMTGIYSTNINDILTVSINPEGTVIESTKNRQYVKHMIDENGIITKTEICIIAPWGTLCMEPHTKYNSDTKKWEGTMYVEQVNDLFDFYKWDVNTSTSMYENVNCIQRDWYVSCGLKGEEIVNSVGVTNQGRIDFGDRLFACEFYNGMSFCFLQDQE